MELYPITNEADLEYYRHINVEETPQAARLAEYLMDNYEFGSIIDLGCATGLYLAPFIDREIAMSGVDINPVLWDEKIRRIPKENIHFVDLSRQIFKIIAKADIVISLETAEHIDEENADYFINNICSCSDFIIFSAAQPGQGGKGHVNCQPKEYWEAKFNSRNYFRQFDEEKKLIEFMKSGYHMGWFINNVMLFRKKQDEGFTCPTGPQGESGEASIRGHDDPKGIACPEDRTPDGKLISHIIKQDIPWAPWMSCLPYDELGITVPHRKFRFHVVSLPHTRTSKEFNACAYTMKVYNFCKMMTDLGHEVYHYGNEGSDVPCTEHIQIFSTMQLDAFFGHNNWKKEMFDIEWNASNIYWKSANHKAAEEISKRRENHDFLCLIGGLCQKPIADQVGNIRTVEFGIGYRGVFAPYRVFESYSHMHKIYGCSGDDTNGQFYDCVIPNYFDPDDFPFSAEKDDYFFFIGRMISRKGVELAVDITRRIGSKLVIAGQGITKIEGNKYISKEFTIQGDHIEFIGYADVKKRGELMSRARAVFVPTYYIGPFEGVNVEAQMCGTPVITTDFGAFTETVLDGVTGKRCRTFKEFVTAAENIGNIDPKACRKWAVDNYSLNRVRWMYQAYFEQLDDLKGRGFYELSEGGDYGRYQKFYP